jgi:hypothetical protein
LIVKSKYLLFGLIALVAIVFGICSTYILPDKYFFDAYLIILDRYNEKGFIGSYSFAMMFYHITGLKKLHFSLVALIQLPIIFLLIRKIGIPDIFSKINLRNMLIWSSLLIFSVYLSIPSKEFINFIYISIICFVLLAPIQLWKKVILSSALFVFFGIWYRPYFILIPIFSTALYIGSQIKIKNKALFNITSGLLIACFVSLSYGVLKGEFMSQSSREKFNEIRVGREDSQTIIVSPVDTETITGESIGIFYGFFSVNFPVNGLKFFYKPQVLAFVFWQILLFSFLVYFYSTCLKNRQLFKHELWIFHYVFAYLIIQGIFEPDLGSAIKHKLGVFPLIYIAMYFNQGLIKYPKNITRYVFKKST